FLDIAQRRAPFDLSPYPFLVDMLPENASLEGFLFPDTYRLPLDADAATLVDMMLRNFGERVTPDLRQTLTANGLNLYEAVTLASIVEREAPLDDERPRVAAVFYNRLAQDMPLQADPTVQYAVGFDDASNTWWKSPLTQADLDLPSPYNTYLNRGLPPGPIANPGLSALEAVAFPLQSNELFFVADCGGQVGQEGAHLFSETYEEHLANVERCRQQ
ncbi:MAG: endolytic transglycosylase MltG, partial [Chloroflexota bacterium]